MIDVYFVRNGSKIRVQSREGLTAMEAAKFESHVPIPEIPADCGGTVSYTHLTLPTTPYV